MLSYKKILLSPDVENGENLDNNSDNYKDRINDLKKEIKELTDDDTNNDEIQSEILNAETGALNGELSTALDNCKRKVVNDLVESLKEIRQKNGWTLASNVEKLLNILEQKQADRIFNDFDGMMTIDKLRDLNSFTDDEIDALKNAITVEPPIISKEKALQLYTKMTSIWPVRHFWSTDQNYYNNIKSAIEGKYTLHNDFRWAAAANEQLWELQLNELFPAGLTADDLNEILKQHSLKDDFVWDGSNIWDEFWFKNKTDEEKIDGSDFISKFNEYNTERISRIEKTWYEIVANLDVTWLTYNVESGKFVKGWQEVWFRELSDVDESNKYEKWFNLLSISELGKDHFKSIREWRETALINRIEARDEARDREESWEFVDGSNLMGNKTVDTVTKINWEGWILENDQFLKLDVNNKLQYNVQKAGEYLKNTIAGNKYDVNGGQRKWTEEILRNPQSKDALAWFAAAQILLNDHYKSEDGYKQLKIDWMIGPKTREITQKFQNDYNREKNISANDDGYLKPDTIAGPLTLNALMADDQQGGEQQEGEQQGWDQGWDQ